MTTWPALAFHSAPVSTSFSSFRQRALLATGLSLWVAVAVAGVKWLNNYSFTPGELGSAPAAWPEGADLPRSPARSTLVVAMHPGCPCSRASLSELESLLAQAGGRLEARVIFAAVATPEPAEASDLFRRAQSLPHVTALVDPEGRRLRAFGLRTSGETRLYRADGSLAYRGGITLARGHVGDNPGRAAVLAALRMEDVCGTDGPANQPVFGCALNSGDPGS